jgi:hypothetical protein
MNPRYDERYEGDQTSSRAVVERCREVICEENKEVHLALVHYRGGEEEFRLGVEYSHSADPLDRAIGAGVLGQLGWSDQTFLTESVDVLIPMLNDADPHVVYWAATSLGHRADPRAIPYLIRQADHPDPQVRFGVVHGLSTHDDPDAIAALIKLAADEDHDTRNWAVFGLGSLTDCDTPEIREALYSALKDADSEIRGEAQLGLALRHDPRAKRAILDEWENEVIGRLSIEAAKELGDPDLLPTLRELRETMDFNMKLESDVSYLDYLNQAIASCEAASNSSAL